MFFKNSLLMGNSEFPAERSQHIFKTPTSSYEFGANLIDPKVYILFVCLWYFTILFVINNL